MLSPRASFLVLVALMLPLQGKASPLDACVRAVRGLWMELSGEEKRLLAEQVRLQNEQYRLEGDLHGLKFTQTQWLRFVLYERRGGSSERGRIDLFAQELKGSPIENNPTFKFRWRQWVTAGMHYDAASNHFTEGELKRRLSDLDYRIRTAKRPTEAAALTKRRDELAKRKPVTPEEKKAEAESAKAELIKARNDLFAFLDAHRGEVRFGENTRPNDEILSRKRELEERLAALRKQIDDIQQKLSNP